MVHLIYDVETKEEFIDPLPLPINQTNDPDDDVFDVSKSPILKDSFNEKRAVLSPEQIEFLRLEIIKLQPK